MPAVDDLNLLEEYNKWAAEKRVHANDVSPASFLVERMQDEALGRFDALKEFLTKEIHPDATAKSYRTDLRNLLGD